LNRSNSSLEENENEKENIEHSQMIPNAEAKYYNKDVIEEYYQYLRDEYHRTKVQYEDSTFDDNKRYFVADAEDPETCFKHETMTFERPDAITTGEILFFSYNFTINLNYEFKIKQGSIADKNFLSKHI